MNFFYCRLVLVGLAGYFFLAPALLEVPNWEIERLEGSWEIMSVQRDGEPDPLQIGAGLIFVGDEVKFLPKAREFVDGMS